MEVQITDFENAAFAVFVVLLSRAILYFNLNFYIPISKVWYLSLDLEHPYSYRKTPQVDQNMQTAQKRDAARSEKFYFRKDVYPHDGSPGSSAASVSSGQFSPPKNSGHKQKKLGNCFTPPGPPVNGELQIPVEDEYELMTMDGIINGKVCPNGGSPTSRFDRLCSTGR